MSKIEHIFLSSQENKEKMNIPNNYDDRKILFSEKLKKESPKNLKFKYIQEQIHFPKEQTNFSEAFEIIKKNGEQHMYIEDDIYKQIFDNMNGLFLSNESSNINLENKVNGSESIIAENIMFNNKIKNKDSELINSSRENNIDSLNNLQNRLKHKNESTMQDIGQLKTEITNYNSIKIEENKNKIKDNQIEKMNFEAKIENLENNEIKKNKTMFSKYGLNLENKKIDNYKKIKSQSLSARKKKKKLKLEFIKHYHQKEKNSLINKRKKANFNEIKNEDEQIKKIIFEETRLKIQLNKKKINNKNKEFEEYKGKTNQKIRSLNKQIEEKDINLNIKEEIIKNLTNELNKLKEEKIIEQGELKFLGDQLNDKNKIINEKDRTNIELKNTIKSLENELNNKLNESKNEKEKNELLLKKYKNEIDFLQSNIKNIKEKNELNKKELYNVMVKNAKIILLKKYKEESSDFQKLKENILIKMNKYENSRINVEKSKKIEFNINNIKDKNNIIYYNNNIINNNIFHNAHIFEKDKYSFKCTNQNELQNIIVLEKSKNLNMEITIENNGKNKWPSNKTKLVFNKDSNLIGEDIILHPQNPGERKNYQINIFELETYPYSIYAFELIFKVDEKQYGEKINFNIEIINKEKKEELEKIEEFRKEYTLSF